MPTLLERDHEAGLPVQVLPALPGLFAHIQGVSQRVVYEVPDEVEKGGCAVKGIHRFKVGQTVWVRDRSHSLGHAGGYCIVEAKVRELHYHPDRHPGYPNGEGYALDGELWWDCYPGCRVFATRAEAIAARMSRVK